MLPAERRRLLDEHPHLREPRPSRPTNGRLPLHGRYGSSVCLMDPNQGCGSVLIFYGPDPELDGGGQYGSGSNTDPGL